MTYIHYAKKLSACLSTLSVVQKQEKRLEAVILMSILTQNVNFVPSNASWIVNSITV